MVKSEDYLHELRGYFRDVPALTAALSALLREKGVPHSPAQRDRRGVCLTCGCSVLCPGVHTFEEIQDANRLQTATAQATMGAK